MILFGNNLNIKDRLCRIKWVHWAVFGLAFSELVFEVILTFKQMQGNSLKSRFLSVMFNNLVIMLTFSPAVSTLILMRWVARNYLRRQYEACLDPKVKIRKEMENFQHLQLDRSSNEDEEE